MNFIIPSAAYRYLKVFSYFLPSAKAALHKISGVEPTLFLSPPLVDWKKIELKKGAAKRIVNIFVKKEMPLSNGQHGLRLHGLIAFGLLSNQVDYIADAEDGAKLLIEQIKFLRRLKDIAPSHGKPAIVTIHLGKRLPVFEDNINRIGEIFEQVLPVAKANGVIVNIETVCDEIHGGCFGSNLTDFAPLVSRFGADENWGITFDFSHTLIHYAGDYEQIKKDLLEYGLLPKINYVHLVTPHWNYRKIINTTHLKSKTYLWQMIVWGLSYQLDSHIGINKFFEHLPEEKERFLDLVSFVIKGSVITEDRFNVINLELGPKIRGTDKGATTTDIKKTIELMADFLGKQ